MNGSVAGRFRKQSGQGELVAIDEDKVARWAAALFDVRNEERLAYWTDARGVSRDVLSELQVGWDSRRRRFTIPVRDSRGRCVDIKLYRPGEKEFGKSLHYTEKDEDGSVMAWGKPPRLWGLDRVAAAVPGKGRAGVVLLCAGEPDAIVATGLGYLAVSPTSGEGALCRQQDIQTVLKAGWPIRILFDSDKAGRAAARVWARALFDLDKNVNVKDIELEFPNGDGKDLTDWVQHDEWGRTGPFEDAGVALWAAIRGTARMVVGDLGGSGGSGHELGGGAASGDSSGGDDGANRDFDTGNGGEGSDGADRRPVSELVTMALEVKLPEFGSRNRAGFWLFCQLRDERYSKNEAVNLVAAWVQAVNAAAKNAGHAYTEDEARLSLDEAYSAPPREANGRGLAYPLTDLGNAERLVHRHGADMAWVPAWLGWAVWTGRVWEAGPMAGSQVARWANSVPRLMYEDGSAAAKRAKAAGDEEGGKRAGNLMSWARKSESAGKLAAMEQRARDLCGVPAEEFDNDARALAVSNGTVVLRDDGGVDFRGHLREDRITFNAPVAYVPDAVGEGFLRFLKEIQPDDEVRDYLQRLVGYSLIGGNPERKFIIAHGPTASGKSTLSKILNSVLGRYAQVFRLSLLREKQDEGPRPDLLGLLPARMIFGSEASDSWHLHADQIKSITGNEPVAARGMHAKVYVTRVPAFTPWLLTNQIPQVKGADAALWRRMIALPFLVTRPVGTEDTGLADRVAAEEGAGVLRWCLDGWRGYVERGLDDPPTAVVEHTLAVRDEMTELDGWLRECTEGGAEYSEFTEVLYENYTTWCMANYVHERDRLSLRQFGKHLSGRGYKPGGRRRMPGEERGSSPKATWNGLRLLRPEKEGAQKDAT